FLLMHGDIVLKSDDRSYKISEYHRLHTSTWQCDQFPYRMQIRYISPDHIPPWITHGDDPFLHLKCQSSLFVCKQNIPHHYILYQKYPFQLKVRCMGKNSDVNESRGPPKTSISQRHIKRLLNRSFSHCDQQINLRPE